MKDDIKVILVILVPVLVLFATTLLLEWDWIQQLWERRIIVWLLLVVELFIGIKIYRQITK